jgi:hypothetical protein
VKHTVSVVGGCVEAGFLERSLAAAAEDVYQHGDVADGTFVALFVRPALDEFGCLFPITVGKSEYLPR